MKRRRCMVCGVRAVASIVTPDARYWLCRTHYDETAALVVYQWMHQRGWRAKRAAQQVETAQ